MAAYVSRIVSDFKGVKPLQALRSVRALIANPDDTGEVFKIIQALKGGSLSRAVERLRSTPEGRELLRTKPDILSVLNDREALRAMPEGSVGRAYLRFVESQSLSADGLVAASEEAPRGEGLSPDESWLVNYHFHGAAQGSARDTVIFRGRLYRGRPPDRRGRDMVCHR